MSKKMENQVFILLVWKAENSLLASFQKVYQNYLTDILKRKEIQIPIIQNSRNQKTN